MRANYKVRFNKLKGMHLDGSREMLCCKVIDPLGQRFQIITATELRMLELPPTLLSRGHTRREREREKGREEKRSTYKFKCLKPISYCSVKQGPKPRRKETTPPHQHYCPTQDRAADQSSESESAAVASSSFTEISGVDWCCVYLSRLKEVLAQVPQALCR
ncbi:hypothetical protein L6164_027604 [Bauhinia variegata]|uniref:Uncharacterized protein n=1 Tax=Bauhinia variegata TaxID=167791 RepID=A0ACB9LTH1_BAUVA|nr:hypothetical protein L6164_027604 [Bauhinia variegata]